MHLTSSPPTPATMNCRPLPTTPLDETHGYKRRKPPARSVIKDHHETNSPTNVQKRTAAEEKVHHLKRSNARTQGGGPGGQEKIFTRCICHGRQRKARKAQISPSNTKKSLKKNSTLLSTVLNTGGVMCAIELHLIQCCNSIDGHLS